MPAYAVCVSIAAMQAVSISLSVFRVRHPIRFFGRKIAFFPLLPRIYAECERFLRVELFSAQP